MVITGIKQKIIKREILGAQSRQEKARAPDSYLYAFSMQVVFEAVSGANQVQRPWQWSCTGRDAQGRQCGGCGRGQDERRCSIPWRAHASCRPMDGLCCRETRPLSRRCSRTGRSQAANRHCSIGCRQGCRGRPGRWSGRLQRCLAADMAAAGALWGLNGRARGRYVLHLCASHCSPLQQPCFAVVAGSLS